VFVASPPSQDAEENRAADRWPEENATKPASSASTRANILAISPLVGGTVDSHIRPIRRRQKSRSLRHRERDECTHSARADRIDHRKGCNRWASRAEASRRQRADVCEQAMTARSAAKWRAETPYFTRLGRHVKRVIVRRAGSRRWKKRGSTRKHEGAMPERSERA